MGTAIRIDALTKVFGSGPAAARAVDGISIGITPGELFFLLGPSGCGKTTLLRMIAGFIDPTSGTIAFGTPASSREPEAQARVSSPSAPSLSWRDVTHAPPNKRNTGMVFQSYALWPHMTVEANVAFGLGVRKVAAAEKAERVAEALRAVQMDAYAQRKPNQLSGGQQQRVALARALVIRPDVLLLDEPLSNLDAKLRNDLRHEIRRICKASGITTVYVTHDQKEALSMADRVALLREGKVVQLGSPRELYRAPNSRFVAEFLGETNILPATVESVGTERTIVRTPAGTLPSQRTSTHSAGQTVLLSLRPEALRLVPSSASNMLSGKHLETTYLGETAQHTVELPGIGPVRVAQLNPFAGEAPMPAPGDPVALSVDPADVVLLPAG